jgi:hypothetical protein
MPPGNAVAMPVKASTNGAKPSPGVLNCNSMKAPRRLREPISKVSLTPQAFT